LLGLVAMDAPADHPDDDPSDCRASDGSERDDQANAEGLDRNLGGFGQCRPNFVDDCSAD